MLHATKPVIPGLTFSRRTQHMFAFSSAATATSHGPYVSIKPGTRGSKITDFKKAANGVTRPQRFGIHGTQ
jgi:hypothetical protein